jgi:hypothetical protein
MTDPTCHFTQTTVRQMAAESLARSHLELFAASSTHHPNRARIVERLATASAFTLIVASLPFTVRKPCRQADATVVRISCFGLLRHRRAILYLYRATHIGRENRFSSYCNKQLKPFVDITATEKMTVSTLLEVAHP